MTAQPETENAARELKERVRFGTKAFAAAQIFSQLVSLGSLAVLMRLLEPAPYGLLAMVMPLVMLLRIFTTLGLNVATVQREVLTRDQASGLFWWSLLLGAGVSAATALCAPLLAWFYAEPRILLLTVALAPTALAAALGSQHYAILERHLRFRELARARLLSQFASVLAAIGAAYAGWGVWALVVQQYAELLLLAGFCWSFEPWRPGLPNSRALIGPHLRLGSWHALSSAMYYLGANLDKVIVGRLAGGHTLGLYNQAFNLMLKPVNVVGAPLNSVLLAALSRAAGNRGLQEELLAAVYRALGILLFPVSVGLMIVAPDFMTLLGGEKWAPAGALLAVLSPAIAAQAFVNVTGPIFTAAGRTDRLFVGSVVVLLVLVQSYLAGAWFGAQLDGMANGVAAAYTLATVLVLCGPYTLFCLRTAGFSARPILSALRPAAWAATVMAVNVLLVRHYVERQEWPLSMRLSSEITIGAAVYCIVARNELRWVWGQFSQMQRVTTAESAA